MRRITLVISLLSFATIAFGTVYGRLDVFHIFAVVPKADFDGPAILKIDSLEVPFPEGSSYPIGDLPTRNGNFTLIKMVCAHPAETSEGERLVHDLLVLKTDGKQIIDAYLYTLEWQDSPSARLARMTAKNVVLKAGMRLSALGMRRSDGEPAGGEELLDNVYQGRKIF